MNAFFSGTDDNDDRKNISFSGVFGKLKDKEPETKWRFNYYEKKFEAKFDHIFEAPPQAPSVDVPQEWLDQVKTFTYQGGNSNLGNVGKNGTSGGRSYDHLKKYQFQKGQPPVYPGSNVRSLEPQRNQAVNEAIESSDFPDAGISGTFFGHNLEAELSQAAEDHMAYLKSQGIEPLDHGEFGFPRATDFEKFAADNALASVTEDPEYTLGKPGVETRNSMLDLEDQDPRSILPGYINGRYEDICKLHGTDVADAWFAIDTEMASLDGKDDLNIELISDFFNFISEEGQVKLIKTLFDQLPRKQREMLETNGL